jgi:hypothetical protein
MEGDIIARRGHALRRAPSIAVPRTGAPVKPHLRPDQAGQARGKMRHSS